MSIIYYTISDIPKKSTCIFADNGKLQDRCGYENNEFVVGADFPIVSYTLKNVFRWFYLDVYDNYFKKQGKDSYAINFKTASIIERKME